MRGKAAIKENEEKFKSLFEGIADSIFIADTSSKKLLDCNERAEKLTGYFRKEILAMRADQLHPKDLVKKTMEDFKKHAAGKILVVETEVLTKNKKRIPVSINSAIINYNGKPCVLGIFRDITEQKKADFELKESEEKFRQFFENDPDYCYMISPEGKILDINRSALKILGYDKKEIIGKPLITTIYAPSSREKARRLLMRSKKTGKLRNEELKIITKKGEERTVLLSADSVRDSKGKLLHSVSVQRDTTERKEMEEEMRIKDSAIKSSIGAIAIADLDGNLNYVNPSFLGMWGYDNEKDVLGKPAVLLWQSEKDASEVIEALGDRGSWIGEMLAKKKDGSTFHAQLSATTVKDADGKPVCTMALFTDITASKKAEEELKKRTKELEKSKQELEERVHDLERFSRLSVGRELRMIELKKRVQKLENLLRKHGIGMEGGK